MSNRRFIELSSTTRNRNLYPQPAEFEVPFAPPRTLNQTNTLRGAYYTTPPYTSGSPGLIYSKNMDVADIVTNGIVEYKWKGNQVIDTTQIQSTSSNIAAYVNVNVFSSPYSTVQDYYVGYEFNDQTISTSSLIQSYTPSSGLFTFQSPLSASPSIGDNVFILDPSNASTLTTDPFVILPGIDSSGKKILNYEQAYNGYYLIDETLSSSTTVVFSKIISYDFLTRKATLNQGIPGWSVGDSYTIRKTLPNEFLEIVPPPSFAGYPLLPSISSYTQINLSNCIFLDPLVANQTDNYYSGSFIYVYPDPVADSQTTELINIEGGCFYINSYIGNGICACFVTSVNPPNVNAPTKYYPSYTSNAINYPQAGIKINIVSFSNDNYTPLIYNGSVVSQNETVAYEISLVNLTLPNIVLVTGARVAFYSYVYVELSNVTASSSSSKNVIYSNNPHSNRALFLVPITDINDPIRSPFIKLDAGSMVQTVKFKPNDCLRFSVFLPDGTLYQTITSDYYTPSGPNPLCQIDALFGIKRLTGV